MLKLWKTLRGYKRHAGALIVVVPTLVRLTADLFGFPVPDGFNEIMEKIVAAGTVIWGIGWADRFNVRITENKK